MPVYVLCEINERSQSNILCGFAKQKVQNEAGNPEGPSEWLSQSRSLQTGRETAGLKRESLLFHFGAGKHE